MHHHSVRQAVTVLNVQADSADTHKWTIFVTSATSPPPHEADAGNVDYLPGGADDLGYMIKRITFKLHDTYAHANRGEALVFAL